MYKNLHLQEFTFAGQSIINCVKFVSAVRDSSYNGSCISALNFGIFGFIVSFCTLAPFPHFTSRTLSIVSMAVSTNWKRSWRMLLSLYFSGFRCSMLISDMICPACHHHVKSHTKGLPRFQGAMVNLSQKMD